MKTCLVTKLKADVNNPNLPVLENMQQLTLDIVAASGNSSMTDTQKWALNHFLYQIGAFDEDGIYSKLSILALPFIAGSVGGAVYNIAPEGDQLDPSGISQSISLSNGGLIASGSSVARIGFYDVDFGITNFSVFYLGGSPVNATLSGTTGSESGNISTKRNNARNITITSIKYASYSTFIDVSLPQEVTPSGMGFNISDEQVYGYATTVNGIFKTSSPGSIYPSELTPWNITSVGPIVDPAAVAPWKGYMFGNGLTDAEFYKFVSALNDLFAQF